MTSSLARFLLKYSFGTSLIPNVFVFFFFYHFSFSLNSITRFGPSSAAGRKTNSCLARNAKMASAWSRWRHDEYERATHRNRASVLGFRNDQQRIHFVHSLTWEIALTKTRECSSDCEQASNLAHNFLSFFFSFFSYVQLTYSHLNNVRVVFLER